MKNIILILFLSVRVLAQPTIVNFSTITLCPGDTICVDIYNPNHEDFYFNIEAPNLLYWFTIYGNPDDQDTTNYCFASPPFLDQGNGFIGIDLVDQIPIILKCNDVGIKEYTPGAINYNAIYFDIYGNKAEPIKGVILIQQIGNHRKKVLFE